MKIIWYMLSLRCIRATQIDISNISFWTDGPEVKERGQIQRQKFGSLVH